MFNGSWHMAQGSPAGARRPPPPSPSPEERQVGNRRLESEPMNQKPPLQSNWIPSANCFFGIWPSEYLKNNLSVWNSVAHVTMQLSVVSDIQDSAQVTGFTGTVQINSAANNRVEPEGGERGGCEIKVGGPDFLGKFENV